MLATNLNRLLILLGGVGICIASVLSYSHSQFKIVPCGGEGGCEWLIGKQEALVFGLFPIAFLGLAAYLVLFTVAVLRAFNHSKYGFLVKFGLIFSGIGTAISAGLVYQLTQVLHRSCSWCFGSAVTMTLTFIVTLLLSKQPQPEPGDSGAESFMAPFALIASIGIAYAVVTTKTGKPGSQPVPALRYEDIIPDPSYLHGNPNAPITIVEVGDFYCPSCRQVGTFIYDFERLGKGNVNIGFRSLPLYRLEGHELSLPAALAAEYAREKGKYFEFVKIMFGTGGSVATSIDGISKVLDRVGVKGSEWKKIYQDTDQKMFVGLDQGMKVLADAGINTTPSFIVYLNKKDPVAFDYEQINNLATTPPYDKYFPDEARR
ncbi:MAG: vitamin K epoxide reductase family protein [Armatimonadetes bacterium]|nr:vitamin K epoxide reductase family protein [Armatimonadota bacterium]